MKILFHLIHALPCKIPRPAPGCTYDVIDIWVGLRLKWLEHMRVQICVVIGKVWSFHLLCYGFTLILITLTLSWTGHINCNYARGRLLFKLTAKTTRVKVTQVSSTLEHFLTFMELQKHTLATMETPTLNLTGTTKLQALTVFANNEWTKVYLCALVLKMKLKCKYKTSCRQALSHTHAVGGKYRLVSCLYYLFQLLYQCIRLTCQCRSNQRSSSTCVDTQEWQE